MRKLSVPYTIKRNGIYYLNLRWNNQFIRQSLATKDPMEAFQKVNQLAPIFSSPQTCEPWILNCGARTPYAQIFRQGSKAKFESKVPD